MEKNYAKPFFITDINRALYFRHLFLIDEDNSIKWWHKNNNDYYILMKGCLGISDGFYFSLNKKDSNDTYIKYIDFIYQKTSYFSSKISNKILSDIMNLLISLAKIDFFDKIDNGHNLNSSDFLLTEIEYILIVCRSLFDLLQEFINFSLSRFEYTYDGGKTFKTINNLPQSFFNLSNHNSEYLLKKYKLPPFMPVFYDKYRVFFKYLRDMRDDIIHYGKAELNEKIYKLDDKGFVFSTRENINFTKFAKYFNLLDENKLNTTSPILPVLAYIIFISIEALSEFIKILENEKFFHQFANLAPNYTVYYRSEYSKYYNCLQNIITNKLYRFKFE